MKNIFGVSLFLTTLITLWYFIDQVSCYRDMYQQRMMQRRAFNAGRMMGPSGRMMMGRSDMYRQRMMDQRYRNYNNGYDEEMINNSNMEEADMEYGVGGGIGGGIGGGGGVIRRQQKRTMTTATEEAETEIMKKLLQAAGHFDGHA